MPKVDGERVRQLLKTALASGDPGALEAYLVGESALPGPRANLELIAVSAGCVGESVRCADLAPALALLDRWAALSPQAAPVNEPRIMLPSVAVQAYGQIAVVCDSWWDEAITRLRRAASDERWRLREMVAMALQRMLAADWQRAVAALRVWLADEPDPLVMRAVVAALAEPPLLTDPAHAEEALLLHMAVLERFGRASRDQRREEAFRALRQGLGYTLSVVVAAVPEAGFAYLESLAILADADIRWIVRENLKKNRLKSWAERAAAVQARL
jgi:hypothetical protein